MITGAHVVLFSPDARADRAFIRDVLGFASVDAGDGWLIFRLPRSEVAVHPTEAGSDPDASSMIPAELYLMCAELGKAMGELRERGTECGEPVDAGWGLLTHVRLPSGRTLGLYEPRHPTALEL